jgi:hypothetical protein
MSIFHGPLQQVQRHRPERQPPVVEGAEVEGLARPLPHPLHDLSKSFYQCRLAEDKLVHGAGLRFPALAIVENIALGNESLECDAATSASAVGIPRQPQLGDFRILRKIGQGGIGVVCEAEQVSLDRDVALLLSSKSPPGHAP